MSRSRLIKFAHILVIPNLLVSRCNAKKTVPFHLHRTTPTDGQKFIYSYKQIQIQGNWIIPDLHHASQFQHIWGCFGEDRVMFGSDWPVCRLVHFEHSHVVKLYRDILVACGASEGQLRKYFYQNTCNFYGLQI